MARILVVDDSPSLARAIKRTLEFDSHHVDIERSVEAARKRLATDSYNLEIWDGSLKPGKIDGAKEAVDRYNDGCNVLVYSADSRAIELAKAYDIPFLVKPVEIEVMLATVTQCLLGRR